MGFLCVISGMVFPLSEAIAINIIFTEFFFIVKYLEGKFIGGGWTGMILGIKKLKFIKEWIQFKGNGNPYVLFFSRLFPAIPLGMVSKYYGSMRYDFVYYSLLSLLGLAEAFYLYENRFCDLQSVFGAVPCAFDNYCCIYGNVNHIV